MEKIKEFINYLDSYTPITAIILTFVPNYKYKSFLISVIFGLPEALIVTLFLIMRAEGLVHDTFTVSLVYIASFWAWVGPILIYKYETSLLPIFFQSYEKISIDKNSYNEIYLKYKKPTTSSIYAKLYLFFWVTFVTFVFMLSYDFMEKFGLTGIDDYWWYIQIIGVSFYAYVTGIGFLFVVRTLLVARSLVQLEVEIDPLSIDDRGGLGFIGVAMSQTTLMFATGAVYIPILLKLNADQYTTSSLPFPLVIVAIYTIMIFLSFTYPIWIFHSKIVLEKNKRLVNLKKNVNKYKNKIKKGKLKFYSKYIIYRDEYESSYRMKTWPFDIDDISTVFLSISLPIVLTLLQIFPNVLIEL